MVEQMPECLGITVSHLQQQVFLIIQQVVMQAIVLPTL